MRPCQNVMVTLSFLLLRRFTHHHSFYFAQQKDLRHKFLSELSANHSESYPTQEGFEPSYHFRLPDLESGAINHSATVPYSRPDSNGHPPAENRKSLPLDYGSKFNKSINTKPKTKLVQ